MTSSARKTPLVLAALLAHGCAAGSPPDDLLVTIDVASRVIEAEVPLPRRLSYDVVASGERIWVASEGEDGAEFWRVDGEPVRVATLPWTRFFSNGQPVIDSIHLPGEPMGMTLNEDHSKLLVVVSRTEPFGTFTPRVTDLWGPCPD